ncbi:Uncharacterised protein [Raoultella planticola]|uniref:Uncharacterized protein n=1 Tax=Raoultella planticola TaxID=575 RepID=A0A485CXP5_RAOPL|nr:Uncharacterised protein [Raoultella planticola]
MGFALSQSAAVSLTGDLLMLAAVIVCGLGYAEGAKLTRVLGGWQVISWALIISLPFMLMASILTLPASLSPDLCFRLAGARLCFTLQHADRLYLLVQRASYWGDCRRRSTTAVTAVPRADAIGYAPA